MKKIMFCLLIFVMLMLACSMPVMAESNTHFDEFDETQDNYKAGSLVSCGDGLMDDIPPILPKVVSIIYTIIQIAVPIILVILVSMYLIKVLIASKEDDIKKGQQMFIKRLISAVLIFFVFIIVKIVVSFAAEKSENEILDCTECFIKNDCTVQK